MRLDIDLAFDSVPAAAAPQGPVRRLDLHTLAGAVRSPSRLTALLRDRDYDEVRVDLGELAPSTLQALALLAAAATRTRRWVLEGEPLGRGRFLLGGAGALARAVPRELWRSAVLAGRIERVARRRYFLRRDARREPGESTRISYLRVEPTLRWLGLQVGGAATHTSGVVNGLIDHGAAVRVFAAERPAGTDRAQFVPVAAGRALHLVRGVGYTDFSEAVIDAARPFEADVVYQRYQMGSYAGLELARALGAPLVLEFNGPEVWVERHWRSGSLLLGRPLERLEQTNLREASLVVVVSDSLRRHVCAHGVPAERVLVNPNGVDVEALAPYRELTPSQWRTRLGVRDAPTVGFIGTFGHWHGVELLPDLAAAVPDAQWILIGGGGLFDSVSAEMKRRGLGDRVSMPGVLERREALELLSCSDVCVSPHVPNADGTPFFGSPTKLFEYMGLRRAIVASDLDQIGEVIEHERSGLLCPPGDVDAAGAAVRRLLGDAALRERLAEGALQRASEVYSWRAHTRRILEALGAVNTPTQLLA